jgi:two-component system phosphorelay protein LuxU
LGIANGPTEQSEAEEQLKAISHSLKSSAASFGAERLCEFATRLDARYKTSEPINTDENRETMITCLHITKDEFIKLTK